MPDRREIKESPIFQGEDEIVPYTLTTTPWGSNPTSPILVIKNSAGVDITSTVTSGTASINDDVITLPFIKSLKAGQKYLMKVIFVIGGITVSAPADLIGRE